MRVLLWPLKVFLLAGMWFTEHWRLWAALVRAERDANRMRRRFEREYFILPPSVRVLAGGNVVGAARGRRYLVGTLLAPEPLRERLTELDLW